LPLYGNSKLKIQFLAVKSLSRDLAVLGTTLTLIEHCVPAVLELFAKKTWIHLPENR